MAKVDGARVLGDLHRLREFGRYETGVHRPTYSPQDLESRAWLAERMREAGLDVTIDGVGNVFGRSPGDGPRMLLGSHAETQPRGGWLDGALGVIYGIEAARAFRDDPACAGLGVDVCAWADEEAHYSAFLGSRSFVGEVDEAYLAGVTSRDDGTPLAAALERAGYAGRPRLALEEGRYRGYLEAHIEQGGYLENTGRRIGVVTGIVGIFLFEIRFTGVQNHAGTTPMPIRKDAGVALVRLATALHDRMAELAAERTVWTIGRIRLEPGVPAVIPGAADMLLQMRDVDLAVMERMEAAVLEMVAAADREGPCGVTVERLSRTPPTAMDAGFQDAIEQAARRRVPEGWMRMPSAAGHDAQILAHRLPAGMMFIPSIGGVSHHFSEDTGEDDIVLGAEVFADAVQRILQG